MLKALAVAPEQIWTGVPIVFSLWSVLGGSVLFFFFLLIIFPPFLASLSYVIHLPPAKSSTPRVSPRNPPPQTMCANGQ